MVTCANAGAANPHTIAATHATATIIRRFMLEAPSTSFRLTRRVRCLPRGTGDYRMSIVVCAATSSIWVWNARTTSVHLPANGT